MTTDPNDGITDKQQYDAAVRDLAQFPHGIDPITAWMSGSMWARTHLAAQEGHRRVRKYADDWDTCACGYDAWPCRSQEPTDAEVEAAKAVLDSVEYADEPQSIRAALSAARAARRDEENR